MTRLIALVLLCLNVQGFAASESKSAVAVYRITGVVSRIDRDSFVLKSEGREWEFKAKPGLLKTLSEGEPVTVQYSMEANEASPAPSSSGEQGEPGQVHPAPGIMDDRAFYGA